MYVCPSCAKKSPAFCHAAVFPEVPLFSPSANKCEAVAALHALVQLQEGRTNFNAVGQLNTPHNGSPGAHSARCPQHAVRLGPTHLSS